MYQRLGNLYTNQRIGSFEADDTKIGRRHRHRNRNVNVKELTNEQLTDKLAKKEMKLTKLQQKAASGNAHAAKVLSRMEPHVAVLRAELADRKNPEAFDGLGAFDLKALSPIQLGLGAVIGAGVYWFVVRPRLR
jgi:hypothetical protein